jgi:hypothetical protein
MHDLATILATPPSPGKSKHPHPFSALPHALRKDPRVKGNNLAIVLAAALLEYCRDRPSCYPTNATLAEDLGCAPSTIRAALAVLKATGWVRVVIGPRCPNGRRIFLTWREITPARSTPPQVSDTCFSPGTHRRHSSNPSRPASTKEEVVIVEEMEVQSEPEHPERSRPEASPTTFSAPGGLVEVIPAPLAALPPPPPAPPAPERVARTAHAPSPLAVQALPPSAETGPREARPAILRAPAGPTPQLAPGPVPGDRAASIAAGPYQSPASPASALQLARSQSIPPSGLGPPALVAAPDAPRAILVTPAGSTAQGSPVARHVASEGRSRPGPDPRAADHALETARECATADLSLADVWRHDSGARGDASPDPAPAAPRGTQDRARVAGPNSRGSVIPSASGRLALSIPR